MSRMTVVGPDVDGILHIFVDKVKTFMVRYEQSSVVQQLSIFKMVPCREIVIVDCVKQKGAKK